MNRTCDRRAARVARAPDRHQRHVFAGLVVIRAHIPVLDKEDAALDWREGGALALEFEDNHAPIMTRGQKVGLLVHRQDPEAIMLAPERLHALPLRHVPHADGLVFGVGDDQLLFGMEERTRDVVDMTAQGVHLPRLRLVHPPQLDLPVICTGDNERQRRVERRPVHPAIMSLKHILNGGVIAAEEVLNLHIGDRLAKLAC
mmetsp:Transcript_28238/g.86273  ORF Transcript_28238/g.86273 Transcript_28238/m.86273 type:complete len:201 (-) Transcript_28238:656-1258(-)